MSTSPRLGPRFVPSPSRKRRKRFLAVGVAGLAVLAAALGISFAGDTGTASISVSSASNSFVYPVANSASLPAAVDSLKYTGPSAIDAPGSTITTATLPSWVPSANTAGSVTTAGDLAVIDATLSGIANAVTVNVYITNLAALQLDYSSFALPFNVYRCQSSCTTTGAWTQASAVVASPPTYLTSTEGFVSFSLPKAYYYVIAIDTGGSLYTISTTASGGSLSPSFYFTSQST